MIRKCPLSGSEESSPYYASVGSKVMISDQRVVPGKLNKIIFNDSGIVANRDILSEKSLSDAYEYDYVLNTSGNDEHTFYTEQGPISRSQVYFNWIEPFLKGNFQSLVEIGAGEGNVMQKIVQFFPEMDCRGFEGSRMAVTLGQKKGLRISQKLIFGGESLPKADLYLLLGVVEHTEDPELFLSTVISSINKGGRLILSIPIQDFGGYDIFFADHIWHFTVRQFEFLLNKIGLDVIYKDTSHPTNYGFGLFVCEKRVILNSIFPSDADILIKNLQFWNGCFERCNELIKKYENDKVAVFGASEVLTLFLTYTSLNKLKIIACIDDSKPLGTFKHGIPIYPSAWLEQNQIDVLMLAVNRKYYPIIGEKFEHLKLNIQPIY